VVAVFNASRHGGVVNAINMLGEFRIYFLLNKRRVQTLLWLLYKQVVFTRNVFLIIIVLVIITCRI